MPTVLTVLAEGFEELEAVAPVDLLRRAGITVTVASLHPGPVVVGRTGLALQPETNLAHVLAQNFDLVLLPGGPGVRHLRADPRIRELVMRQHTRGALLAAICAAPTILQDAGLLKDRRYTAHPSVANEMPERLGHEKVVRDGHIITSRGAGTAIDFGLTLVASLTNPATADDVGRSIAI